MFLLRQSRLTSNEVNAYFVRSKTTLLKSFTSIKERRCIIANLCGLKVRKLHSHKLHTEYNVT